MDELNVDCQQLIQAIAELPDESLAELARFVAALRHQPIVGAAKAEPKPKPKSGKAFLLAITGLGTCAEDDISERDEEILASEIDPIYGWSQTHSP